MLRRSRRYLLLLLAVLALGVFLYRFRNSITLEGFHWSMVGQSIRDARISLLLLSIATIYLCHAIRSLRWMRFSRALGATHFGNVYSATLMGFACTFLLGRAGEPIRPVLIAKKDSLPIPGMFGVYVLERVADFAATVVLATIGLLLFQRRAHGSDSAADELVMKTTRSAGLALLIGLVLLVSFLIYFRYHGAQWLARKLSHPSWRSGWREKIALLLDGFSDGLQGIRTWSDLGMLVWYTAAHWFLIALVYLWIAHALGGELAQLDFSSAVLVFAFTMVGSAAQLPGVGGGAQLATFLVLTLIFGVEKEAAVTAAVLIWLITFAAPCLVGVPMLFREGWSMGELRKMAEAGKEEAKEVEEAELAGLAGLSDLSDVSDVSKSSRKPGDKRK
jgi:glycosyltransferase 2 family protein